MFIAIVDDEKFWREKIYDYVKKRYGADAIIDVYSSGVDFNIARRRYDIVLMDVEMPQQDGFVAISDYKRLYSQCIPIILTSHMEISHRGYLVSAFRYVSKENMEEELKEAFDSAEHLLEMNRVIVLNGVGLGAVRVKIREILYIETLSRNILVHTEMRNYKCRDSIASVEEKLEGYPFFRSHKSYIVNLDRVKSFDKNTIYFADGSEAFLSQRRVSELKEKYVARLIAISSM